MDLSRLNFIIKKFFVNSEVLNVNLIESGLINKTYLVEHLQNGVKSKFILQALSNIFESHEILIRNHKLITGHIIKKINKNSFFKERWEVPSLIRCKSNRLYSLAFESEIWRAMLYIDNSLTFHSLDDQRLAYQVGIGLSKFHFLCSDLDSSNLKKSIQNFHNTSYYLNQYTTILDDYNFMKLDNNLNKRLNNLINCLSDHIEFVELLLIYISNRSINTNVIHGDPKLSNFLFDIQSRHVVSLIDLDTVSSGYLLTDLADCIRSISNLAGEDPIDDEKVFFDMNTCNYFLKGYFSLSLNNSDNSFRFLPEFIYLIIFELTIRFLIDFLQSNRCFHIKYEAHNLSRAEVQFRLLSSFITQIPDLANELREYGICSSTSFVSDVQKFV